MKKVNLQIGLTKLVVEKVEKTVTWTYVIEYLHGEKNFWNVFEKELLGNQTEFEIKKVIKRKGDKL